MLPSQCNKDFQFRDGTCVPKGGAACANNPCGANGECKGRADGTYECKVDAASVLGCLSCAGLHAVVVWYRSALAALVQECAVPPRTCPRCSTQPIPAFARCCISTRALPWQYHTNSPLLTRLPYAPVGLRAVQAGPQVPQRHLPVGSGQARGSYGTCPRHRTHRLCAGLRDAYVATHEACSTVSYARVLALSAGAGEGGAPNLSYQYRCPRLTRSVHK